MRVPHSSLVPWRCGKARPETALKLAQGEGIPEEEREHVTAIAHFLSGEWKAGLSILNGLPSTPERATWKCEALRQMGRFEESLRWGEQAKDRNGVRSLCAEINVQLSAFEADDLDGQVVLPQATFEPILNRLRLMFPEWSGEWNGKVRFLRQLFQVALHRFHGNRTAATTFVDSNGGILRPLRGAAQLPGERLPLVLRRLFLESYGELDEELSRLGDYSPALLGRIELALRHGQLQEATSHLDTYEGPQKRSLEAQLTLMGGNPERAIEVLDGERSPAADWIRAEAMWRLGQPEKARGLLHQMDGEGGRNSLRIRLLRAGLSENPVTALEELRIIFPVAARFIPLQVTEECVRDTVNGGLDALGGFLSGGMESVRTDEQHLLGVNELR